MNIHHGIFVLKMYLCIYVCIYVCPATGGFLFRNFFSNEEDEVVGRSPSFSRVEMLLLHGDMTVEQLHHLCK
jgi:hypothetical protein